MSAADARLEELARTSTDRLVAAATARVDTGSGRVRLRRAVRARRLSRSLVAVLVVLLVGAAVVMAGSSHHRAQPTTPPIIGRIVMNDNEANLVPVDPVTGAWAAPLPCSGTGMDVAAASPDGTHLALSTQFYLVSAEPLVSCDIRTGGALPLVQVFGLPAVRWTNSAITVASFGPRQRQLVIDRVQGASTTRETYALPVQVPSDGGPIQASWSPDGTRLALSTTSATGNGLYVMDADGSHAHALAVHHDGGSVGTVAWSPDGRHIAYLDWGTNPDRADLKLINPDGSGGTDLGAAYHGADSRAQDDWGAPLVWSPDSTRIAYFGGDPLADESGLWVTDLDGHPHYLSAGQRGHALLWPGPPR